MLQELLRKFTETSEIEVNRPLKATCCDFIVIARIQHKYGPANVVVANIQPALQRDSIHRRCTGRFRAHQWLLHGNNFFF